MPAANDLAEEPNSFLPAHTGAGRYTEELSGGDGKHGANDLKFAQNWLHLNYLGKDINLAMRRGDFINQLLQLGGQKAYFHKESYWFHNLKLFPGLLISPDGYVRFETEQEYLSSPQLRIQPKTNTVHALPAITALVGYQAFSDAQLALLVQAPSNLLEQPTVPTDEKTLRRKRQIEAIVRNQKLVADLKKKYASTCQICGTSIQVRPNRYYSEVHHLQPLGQPHNGPDHESNMLCVCPNHHTLLDFFAIRLEPGSLKADKHLLSEVYINYHNEQFEKLNNS